MGVDGARLLFVELAKADTSGDYEKAVKIANKILRQYPKETSAFKCKTVALIQLGHFAEALALMKKTPSHQMGECGFEKAYAQYRLNDDNAALETLSKLDASDVRCMELKAQVLYRKGSYEEALLLLRKLLKDHSDDYDDERRANLIAVESQLHALGHKQKVEVDLETYEQLYNASCHLIETSNFPEALKLLEKAERLCRSTLGEEGLSEEEISDELSVIRVQKAFVLQCLHRSDDALKIYLDLQQIGPSDKSVLATLSNNISSARKEQNLLEARKKLKTALQIDGTKLTTRQRRTLALNQAIVHLLSNQREPCRRFLETIKEDYGHLQEAVLIEAALHLRLKESQKALSVLKSAEQTRDVKLTAIQIAISENQLEDASRMLAELDSGLALRPAILQLRIAILLALNNEKAALELLSFAIDSGSGKDESSAILLEQASNLYMHLGDYQEAVNCLQKLISWKSDDLKLLCRLIKAYSAFDTERAQELSERLFPVEERSAVDIDALEQSDWVLYGERYRQRKENKEIAPDTEIVTGKLRKRKRKRKVVLPKNYDPNIPPDPERWLPRQERTAYKKRLNKRHKDRDIGRGTQGAVSSDSPQLDAGISKAESVENSPKPTPVMGGEGPRQLRPAGQQVRRKKKKGVKW